MPGPRSSTLIVTKRSPARPLTNTCTATLAGENLSALSSRLKSAVLEIGWAREDHRMLEA